MSQLLKVLEHNIENKCCVCKCYNNHTVNVNMISCGIRSLKSGKKDGNKGLCTNHVLYGTTMLEVKLSFLFTSMLTHAVTPHDLLMSTVIPIPKNKRKSLNDSENYRGIALSSGLGKLFDWILLLSNKNVLSASDLQIMALHIVHLF